MRICEPAVLATAVWGSGEVPGGCRGKDQCGQATKGVWGMSRRQEAMKGVEDCDKPGEAVKQALIPGYPSERGELKHLSTRRKRKKNRFPQ